MNSPTNMPTGVRQPRGRLPCRREGCTRPSKGDGYCCRICRDLDSEFDRLQELYDTAGDPTLSREAWLALSTVADQWTEYSNARFKLHRHIRDAGLPMP
jgi:hypothetical protein